MKNKLKQWLKTNYDTNLSYWWYYKNVPAELEEALIDYKKDFFDGDNIKNI